MTKLSYKKRQKILADEKQYVLDPTRASQINPRSSGVIVQMELKQSIYFCPFCLFFGAIHKFETRTACGKPSKKMQCPDCHNYMLRRTLETRMSPKEYADWVFMYRLSGFWKKCNWEVWISRLWKLGMAEKFWQRYKQLKGTTEYKEGDEGDMRALADEYHKGGLRLR